MRLSDRRSLSTRRRSCRSAVSPTPLRLRVAIRYAGRWNLQYSSFSRASSGHCQPSALRYRHWMRGLSITEVMVNHSLPWTISPRIVPSFPGGRPRRIRRGESPLPGGLRRRLADPQGHQGHEVRSDWPGYQSLSHLTTEENTLGCLTLGWLCRRFQHFRRPSTVCPAVPFPSP